MWVALEQQLGFSIYVKFSCHGSSSSKIMCTDDQEKLPGLSNSMLIPFPGSSALFQAINACLDLVNKLLMLRIS